MLKKKHVWLPYSTTYCHIYVLNTKKNHDIKENYKQNDS